MKSNMRILAAAVLLALAPMAQAQTSGSQLDAQSSVLDQTAASRGQVLVAQKIASNFTSLAGSEENAVALVNALRTGDTVKLTYPAPTSGTGTATGTGTGTAAGTPTVTTIDPPTAKMGWGNVKISLALAQDALARAGITNPTGEQLQAALNGGSVTVKNPDGTTTTTKLTGILQMRADGMGWGEIAKASGTKVGPVVSQLKMANTKVKALPPEPTSTASTTPTAKSVTTAASGPSTQPKSKGVTTATGSGAGSTQPKSKGITTATGSGAGSTHGSKGLTTAAGAAGTHGSKGLVTADGAVAGSTPKGNAHGRGVVTAAGGNATNVAAAGAGNGRGHGAGVVTATGGSASSGVTNANGGGNGKGPGNGKGKGPGGG